MNNEVNFEERRPVRRSLLAGAVSVALLMSSAAQALGLGEAEVQSFLNQPLKVSIPIIIENEGERESLRVDLASNDDFRKVGLDRAALGLSLDVELQNDEGEFRVLLSSTSPVRDPFLQILLNADWSSGRLLRQYTLFLDPPTLETPSIQVRNEPPPATSSRPTTQRTETRTSSTPAPTSRPSRSNISGDSYGPVAAGETLWSIASRSNPNSSQYSVNQVMLAYVRLNPDAFHQGNVNSMKRGASLSVPATQDIAVVNAQEALRIVQQQHRDWRSDFSSGGSSSSAFATNNSGSSSSNRDSDRQSDRDGRLQLVPPEESTAPITNSAGLKAELARLEEELFATRLENADLVQQVDNLRSEIARLEGNGIQDRSLAEFQNYLGEEQTSDDESQAYVDPFVNEGFDSTDDGSDDGLAATDSALGGTDAATDAIGSDAGLGTDDSSTAQANSSTTPPAGGATPVQQDNTPPTVTIDTPASTPAAQSGDSFFSPFTIGLAVVGGLAIALLIWTQRKRDQQGDKDDALTQGKSRFSAKNLLAANKEKKSKKDKAEKKDKRKVVKKGGAASLADRLIEASKQQKPAAGPAASAVPPPAPKPAAAPPPPPPMGQVKPEPIAAAPPPAPEPDDFLAPPPKFAETAAPAEPTSEPEPVAAVEEQVEDDLDKGLDFILNDEPEPEAATAAENSQDAADDLLRRLANEDEDASFAEEAPAEEAESGLDFDLSGMEHLISSSGSDDGEVLTDPAEEEDPYEAVLRGMSADDEEDIFAAAAEESEDASDSMAGPDEDEVEIKLDLARAYISMGDNEAASTILDEILSEGSDAQRAEARNLLKQV